MSPQFHYTLNGATADTPLLTQEKKFRAIGALRKSLVCVDTMQLVFTSLAAVGRRPVLH